MKVTLNDPFGAAFGNVVTVPVSDYAPAFFEIGNGQVAALDLAFRLINGSNPARRAQIVQLYANGLGPLNSQPASGQPAPLSPLATCKTMPSVTIGGQAASVDFCGLAPGFPGLYQINVLIPPTLSPGTHSVILTAGDQTSKAATIIVQ
jgi:uncharacterized protein (TIGR03437 family)